VLEDALEIGVELLDFLGFHRPDSPDMDSPGFSHARTATVNPAPAGTYSDRSTSWSMAREGSSQPDSPTMRAGTPATVLLGGTEDRTTEPDATLLHRPTSILPRILAPAPISTPWRIFGWRSPSSLPVPPRVTPCSIETLSSTTAVWPMTMPVA